jgi:hypothetical protein
VQPASFRPRSAPRRKLRIPVVVTLETGERITQAVTLDVSKGGAKLKLDRSIELPDQFFITLSERGDVQRLCRVVWRGVNELGVRFIEPQQARSPSTKVVGV